MSMAVKSTAINRYQSAKLIYRDKNYLYAIQKLTLSGKPASIFGLLSFHPEIPRKNFIAHVLNVFLGFR